MKYVVNDARKTVTMAYSEIREFVTVSLLGVVLDDGLEESRVRVLGHVGNQVKVGARLDSVLGADDLQSLVKRNEYDSKSAVGRARDGIELELGAGDRVGLRIRTARRSSADDAEV